MIAESLVYITQNNLYPKKPFHFHFRTLFDLVKPLLDSSKPYSNSIPFKMPQTDIVASQAPISLTLKQECNTNDLILGGQKPNNDHNYYFGKQKVKE